MSLSDWRKNGWLQPHNPSPREITELLAVVERDLSASIDPKLDGDWRFAIAYNAAIQCAAMALKASGNEAPKGGGAHYRTIESLRFTIGADDVLVEVLQKFRASRGDAIYRTVGIASNAEIDELRKMAVDLRDRVKRWLETNHPKLLSGVGTDPKRRKKGKT
jgi:hypothetical protein